VARVRFTRRCFEEDLQALPARAQREALALARAIERAPNLGRPLRAPLERFRTLRLRSGHRLVYTHDPDTDTWWIYLIGRRTPGRRRDVYEALKQMAGKGEPLR
jgi:mRNA-degrading endonuclease RelE of RelBE toxin-antitoxin system